MKKTCYFFLIVLFLSGNCMHTVDLPQLTKYSKKSGKILIKNATLFTGNPNEKIEKNINILIDQGRFETISKKEIPSSGAEVIDAEGKMVIPGLIDSHVHIHTAGSPPTFAAVGSPERNLSVFLYTGITSVVDMGGPFSIAQEAIENLEEGDITGPHIYYAGKTFCKAGGHPAGLIRRMLFWPISSLIISGITYEIEDDTEDSEIIEYVKECKENGSMFIKVMIDEVPLGVPNLTVPELKKIVKAAESEGLITAAHVGCESDLLTALEAGVKVIAHTPYRSGLFKSSINIMKESNAVLLTTIAVFDNIALYNKKELKFSELELKITDPVILQAYKDSNTEDLNQSLKELAQVIENYKDIKFKNLIAMKKAGIPIIASSDSPNIAAQPGTSMYTELELLVDRCGFTPLEAVASATYVPGKKFLPLITKDGRGYIKTGLPADLVILEDDFRKDIRNIQKIDTIIIDGKIVDRD